MYSPIQIMMFKSVEGDIQHFQKVALGSIGYVGLGHSFLAIARLKNIKKYYNFFLECEVLLNPELL